MEFITLELRPRLQSCNVFIAMRPDFCFKKKLEVKVLESHIVLSFGGSNVKLLLPSIKVIPNSLSMLSVTNNWIYFRLQMAPFRSVFGSFNTEIITDSCTGNSSTIESVTRSPCIFDDVKSLFRSSERCNILCTCCKDVVSRSINFKRFLPLPDTEYDPDEWFCCKDTRKVVPSGIRSRETDYLYGPYFSVLHRDIFASNVQTDENTLICGRCSSHLGMLHAYNLFKIWNCCVDYESCDDAGSTVNATDPLDDFLTLVKVSLTNESRAESEEIILQTSKRLHCLRVRPMDRKLSLMTEPSDGVVVHDTDTIVLQRKYVAKVLYEYRTNDTVGTINDTNITHHRVNLSMIEAGFKYLLSSTKRLPHIYRTAVAPNCFFGYIVLQETIN